MREIIFRGKLTNGYGWAEGNLNIRKNEIAIITPDETPIGIYGRVDPETVGQYTGVNDKNGVRIFEGDILQNTITDENYILTYNEKDACFTAVQKKGRIKIYLNLTRSEDFYVVIGNIHDNPELLKESEK